MIKPFQTLSVSHKSTPASREHCIIPYSTLFRTRLHDQVASIITILYQAPRFSRGYEFPNI